MPSFSAQITKQTIRRDVARRKGGYHTRATTGSGSTTTLVIGALSGIGQEYVTVDEPWYLCNDGNNAGEFRRAVSFAGSTVTTGELYTNTVASGVSVDSYPYPPNLYTEAINIALAKSYHRGLGLWKPVNSYIIPNGTLYSLPRGMTDVVQMEELTPRVAKDLFNRSNSATSAGGSWTADTGTWGINSERLYSVTDADADFIDLDVSLKNGVIRYTMRGTLNSATVYRIPSLCFRVAEDADGDIDTNNYLVVRLRNALVELRKVDGGTESSLTTATQTTADGTDYELTVDFNGVLIRVWVDDVQLISYSLTGLNLKYLDYPRMAIRWDKAGSPATAARVDSVYAYSSAVTVPWRDWKQPDSLSLSIPAFGSRAPSAILRVDGAAMLSLLAADSTAGALTNDTTATIEITTTEEGYQRLIMLCVAELKRLLGEPDADAVEAAAMRMPGMRRVVTHGRGPMQ